MAKSEDNIEKIPLRQGFAGHVIEKRKAANVTEV